MYQRDLSLILDNSALDARPVFAHRPEHGETGRTTTCGPEISFGGPLRIPHLLHGQGQFFVNYQAHAQPQ